MLRTRVMPCLLLQQGRLVKTVAFGNPSYVGDPINAVRIFNEKLVDELVLLDISAREEGRGPDLALLPDICGECFMPVAYGGGVTRLDEFDRLFALGVEKVAVNTAAADRPELVTHAARRFGSQSVVVSMDARAVAPGRYEVFVDRGRRATGLGAADYARRAESLGAGELLVTSIDRDGSRTGYEIELIRQVSQAVGIPVVASGGAGKVADFGAAVREGGAAACAAGAMVVWFGRAKAVLINFPSPAALSAELH